MSPEGAEGGIEFRASWRSTLGLAVAFMMVLTVGSLWITAAEGFKEFLLIGFAIFMSWMCWLLGRQFWSRQPVLHVSSQGVSGFWLKGHTVPWSEIVDIHQEVVQGHSQIQLTLLAGAPSLAPTASLLNRGKALRSIPLGALATHVQPQAVEAVQRAFMAYGGSHARAAAYAHVQQAAAASAFEDRLRQITPTTWALYLMVALNVGVWLANVASGLSIMAPSSPDLLRWGANSAWAVVNEGEYWRLLTAAFLHGGLFHLALNMLGLWSAGQQLNRLYGNFQFLLIYLASALAGSALSLHFAAQASVAVGASGAVFGVLGALLVALYQHRRHVPSLASRNILTSQGIFLVYALVQGFGKQGIDNAAHVGGLVMGALMAWLLVVRIDDAAAIHTSDKLRQRQGLGVAVACVIVAALVWTTPEPRINHRQLFALQAGVNQLLPQLQAAELGLQKDAAEHKAGRMTDAQMLEAIEKRHLPAYRAVGDALGRLELSPGAPGQDALFDLREQNRLMADIMELEVRQAKDGADVEEIQRKLVRKSDELKAVSQRMGARAARKPGKSAD
jgi:rhomboid protease GluP